MKCNADVLSLRYDELVAWVAARGLPKFRAKQLFDWLHAKQAKSFTEMTDLPLALREMLAEETQLAVPEIAQRQQSSDGTVKYLLRLADGNCIETVVLRYDHGLSVCVSTQVGCAMGCAFCASTVGGLVRSLAASEILAQVYTAAREADAKVDHVVLMGIGEPLENMDAVLRFCDIITDARGYNLAGRNLTLSTCGIVPEIEALADQKRSLTLSVSLHAAADDKRDAMMPVNRRWPLSELMKACRYYFDQTGRRITYEYAVIHGQNDSEQDAADLAGLLRGQNAHINLIPVNPARNSSFAATRADAEAFAVCLKAHGLVATVRRTLGTDIEAACGQLRRKEQDRVQP